MSSRDKHKRPSIGFDYLFGQSIDWLVSLCTQSSRPA